MNIGKSAISTAVDDLSQPQWLKNRSLKEIELIRDSQRQEKVQQVLLKEK
jgi:hypothetical protein